MMHTTLRHAQRGFGGRMRPPLAQWTPSYLYCVMSGKLHRAPKQELGPQARIWWERDPRPIRRSERYRAGDGDMPQRPAGHEWVHTSRIAGTNYAYMWFAPVMPAPATESAPDRLSDDPNTPAAPVGAGEAPF